MSRTRRDEILLQDIPDGGLDPSRLDPSRVPSLTYRHRCDNHQRDLLCRDRDGIGQPLRRA